MDYINLLNDEQIKPVMDTEGAVLVLAGAGSGKTRVLTYRIARLISDVGVSPYNILAITFTNKAAREMTDRIAKVTGTTSVWISTFHSMCARILRQDIDKLGYPKDFSIYSASDSDKVIKRLLAANCIDDDKLKKSVGYHISNAKNLGLSPNEYLELSDFDNADIVCKIYGQYQENLHSSGALDFDDLMLKTIQLFKDHSDVLNKWQDRFRYVHVDEFQDTNKVQLVLVKLLSMKHGNIFAVGDDDQSIYGWRGAEIENIINFKKYFAGCRTYKLQRNYRSTQSILDCANSVIAHNESRLGKELYTTREGGMKVTYRSLYSDRDEVDFVVREIDGLRRNTGYKYSDFAVLVRLNSLTRKFEEQFGMYGIPYRVYGGFKFYDRKEVQDVIAYLRLVVNERDREAMARVINFPKRGVGEVAIGRIFTFASEHNISVVEATKRADEIMSLNAGTRNKVADFGRMMMTLIDMSGYLPLEQFIAKMIDIIGIKNAYNSSDQEDQNRLENITEYVGSVVEHCKVNQGVTLSEYLQTVALVSDSDQAEDTEKVTIATVHSVKGLEYRCVFIVGMEEGIFPSARAIGNKREEEEERRCMYVAITRAEERLYLTSCGSRFRFGKQESNYVSRFIREAGIVEKVKIEENMPKIATKPHEALKTAYDSLSQSVKASVLKPNLDKDISGYTVGRVVVHSRYGEGTILAVNEGSATIKFDKLGIKEFVLRMAPLQLKD